MDLASSSIGWPLMRWLTRQAVCCYGMTCRYEAWHQRLSVRLLDSARSSASAKAQEIGDALNAWAGSVSRLAVSCRP